MLNRRSWPYLNINPLLAPLTIIRSLLVMSLFHL
ncbi:hypothetical protein BN975_02880 [Mycolicibacterium farcinogenes]|uniref:Uncharacterized protein n=1 Tax=Mycolicibacterium senegalense TaxID=1796 RepID=A0A378W693_9MYCO|nr:hypothetical protein [Mycolicibacterium senegalense]CDP86685.1 hypothetical protein BN975_02880 [Mycolicibacterium farcinogenes]SUA28516.1 Uncharacterised protein [Mycolicibacterium senegalense]